MFTKKPSKLCLNVLVVFLFLFSSASAAWGKEVAGIVTSVSGTWLVDGIKLYRGQRLPVGALIKAKEPNPKYSRVVILLLDHTEISRTCNRQGRCGEPIKLPDEVNSQSLKSAGPGAPSFWARFVIAMNSFRARRPRYRKTLARGGGSLEDAVVRLDKGQIDLQPVLSNIDAQSFLLTIMTITDETDTTPTRKIVERLPLRWDGKGQAVISVPDIKPGLYQVDFAKPAKEESSPTDNVWILIVESSQFQKVSSEYLKARALTDNWEGPTEPNASTFLRAFLETLATEENLLRGAERK